MRVEATPLLLNTASSRRCTIVSVLPRAPGVPVAMGAPLKKMISANGEELAQKKPEGIGLLAKS